MDSFTPVFKTVAHLSHIGVSMGDVALRGLSRLAVVTWRFRREAPLIRNASNVRRIACWKRVFQFPVELPILLALRILLARFFRHGVSSVPLD
jgi:hypothetical protein